MKTHLFGRRSHSPEPQQPAPPVLDPLLFADIKPPSLTLDSQWQEVFKGRKTEKITALENQITELMKENARLNETEEALIAKKKKCLQQILQLSGDVQDNSAEAKEATAAFQRGVLDCNKLLEETAKRLDVLPAELEAANRELMIESLSIIYESMHSSRQRLSELDPKIETLRAELKQAVADRAAADADTKRTYQLLHSLLGGELANKIDHILSNHNGE